MHGDPAVHVGRVNQRLARCRARRARRALLIRFFLPVGLLQSLRVVSRSSAGRPVSLDRPAPHCPYAARMPVEPLTLMAVHAHPDDEAIGTGGILARYADEGVQTVLVTCTNGELGDAPGGLKPGDPGHDEEVVVPLRRAELEASSEVLGVSHLELLGYHDSGMDGWPQNDASGSFWRTPVEEAAHRLADLMRTYGPQVVVTYDENGFYGHPDHIQANR